MAIQNSDARLGYIKPEKERGRYSQELIEIENVLMNALSLRRGQKIVNIFC